MPILFATPRLMLAASRNSRNGPLRAARCDVFPKRHYALQLLYVGRRSPPDMTRAVDMLISRYTLVLPYRRCQPNARRAQAITDKAYKRDSAGTIAFF